LSRVLSSFRCDIRYDSSRSRCLPFCCSISCAALAPSASKFRDISPTSAPPASAWIRQCRRQVLSSISGSFADLRKLRRRLHSPLQSRLRRLPSHHRPRRRRAVPPPHRLPPQPRPLPAQPRPLPPQVHLPHLHGPFPQLHRLQRHVSTRGASRPRARRRTIVPERRACVLSRT
jgi:hypothetical protein